MSDWTVGRVCITSKQLNEDPVGIFGQSGPKNCDFQIFPKYANFVPEATWQGVKGINSYQPLVPEKTDGKRLPFWEGVEKVLYPGILVTSQIQIRQPILAGLKVLPATI